MKVWPIDPLDAGNFSLEVSEKLRQVSFTLLMISIFVVIIVIQLSTRGTVDSHNWYLRLADKLVPRSYHA